MPTIAISDTHLEPRDDIASLVEIVQYKAHEGHKIVLLGDIYEGFLHKPWRIPELACCHWLIGNHEFMWRDTLIQMYGADKVSDYLWINGVYCCHGNEWDPWQDTEIEMALAAAALRIYSLDPTNPFLDFIYDEIMTAHRTNEDIINGLIHAGVSRGLAGHSHVAHEGMVCGVEYFNPGAWKEHPAYVQIEDNGEMHYVSL